MERTDDFVIGRDVVLEEYDHVSDLLSCLPLKAQHGAKSLMGQVHKLRLEHGVQGVKNLFNKVKETAQENLRYVKIDYNCFDASHDVVVLGTNLGVIFLFDRFRKHLSRLVIESQRNDVTSVKLLASHSLVAGGHADGKISIFSFVLASQGYGKTDSLQISSSHEGAITCLEWSPDAAVLYSGDVNGKIVMTVVKFGEATSQTALLFLEDSPVVQLSYSTTALLVSTHRRTVIWKFSGEEPIQIGQKERKILDNFGGCFYPPARQAEDTGDLRVVAFVARPGLRLWSANIDGTVSATLMYKGLVNEHPPEIKTLCSASDSASKAANNQFSQFGRLLVFHGQFIVTWDKSRLWVLDTSPCSVVGYLDDHGPILDVCTIGHEIFLLRQSVERMVVKFSLIPKIPNPLIKILVVHDSPKEDPKNNENIYDPSESQTEMELKETDHHLALNAEPKADKTLGVVSSDVKKDSFISRQAETEKDATVTAPSLTSRFDNIPEQDYGDIVYSKAKRKNRKKKQKNGEKGKKTVVRDDIGPLQGHRLEPLLDDFSDVSSEADLADRNESSVEQNSDQDPETTLIDSLLDTSSEQENISENLKADSSSHDDGKGKEDLRLPNELQKTGNTNVTREGNDFKSEDGSRWKETAEPPILPHINETKPESSPEFESSNHPNTKRSSTPVNVENKTRSPASLEEYLSPPYLAKSFSSVYSSAEVNLSDISFSSKSLDKSSQGGKKLIYSPPAHPHESSLSVVDSVSEESSEAQPAHTSAENTPPCVLDSDGAEELVDTTSWKSSKHGSVSNKTSSETDGGSLVSSVETLQSDTISATSQETLTESEGSAKPNLRLLADSWADYAGPNQSTVQYLTVSDTHLWCITSNDSIYYCPTHFSVTSWIQLDGSARLIATNKSGDVIWCIDRKNYAYYRARVSNKHLTGKEWCPVEKDMRFVAVDENCVWGIKMNGDVFVKTDVSRQQPQGKGWQTVKLDTGFVQASCLDGIVWFLDKKHVIHVYKGIDSVKPSNAENWEMLADVSAKWICLGVEGVAFIVDPKGSLWFTTNVTQANRTGGSWFQISLGQYLMQDAGVLESFWSWVRPEITAVTQAPKELIESLWSWVKRGDEAKLISASPKAGLWVQGSQGSMHAVHGHLLGSRWDPAVPTGVAQSVFWSYVSAGGYLGDSGHVWATKPNGEMICYRPGGRSTTLEPPKGSVLKLLSVSGMSVWGIKHNFKVVQRAGISNLCPEGYRWVDVNLEQFGIGKVMHLSCGALSTWAVDEGGQIWLRIGREEDDSSVTQAWLPVEGKPLSGCRFAKVAVSPQDRVVWAVDDRNNVYARDKLTPSFPIGTSWLVVPGTGVKDICMSEHMVWATCPNGDIACRYGVSENNCVGDYWKKVPGNFELISVSPDDQLWAIDQNGQLFHRKTQLFYGTQAPLKPRSYSTLFSGEDDWEFI